MPVPTQIGSVVRHCDVVPRARRNLLMTSWANIGFEGLIGLNAAYFDRAVQT